MAAMIWDSAAQAFVETANTPMRYDPESGAWVETTGMVWDASAEAWVEKWSPNRVLYLYKDGDECVDVTGGWKLAAKTSYGFDDIRSGNGIDRTSITTKRANDIRLYVGGICNYTTITSIHTANKIDCTKYSKVGVLYSFTGTPASCHAHVRSYQNEPDGTTDVWSGSWGVGIDTGSNRVDYSLVRQKSKIGDTGYVCAWIMNYGEGDMTGKTTYQEVLIKRIWLEK